MKKPFKIQFKDEAYQRALLVDWVGEDGVERGVSFPVPLGTKPSDLPEIFREIADYLELRRKDGVL